jgi:Icc-related predicted phosphoesterase
MIPEGIDVLLVHGPPHGYGDTVVRGERVGCEELTRAIDKKKPKVVCFGHIHEDTGVWKRNDSVLVNCSIGYRVGRKDVASREPFVFEIVDGVVKY